MMKRHAFKSLRRRLKSKQKKKNRNKGIFTSSDHRRQDQLIRDNLKKKYSAFKWVTAPPCFSLIKNTNRTIVFINKINKHYKNKSSVFIDLEHVKEIDHDAIVLLLALMVQFRSDKIPFNGNFSKKASVNRLLKESDFFEYLKKKSEEFSNREIYDLSPLSNSIYTHAQKQVNSELSANIIKKASKAIWGTERRCTGVQRVFLELMQNTNNHASKKTGDKHWWVSTNYIKSENKVCFSFIDFGIGIFESLTNKKPGTKFFGVIPKLFQRSKNKDTKHENREVLELLLKGEVHKTATGKYYRGKGLPGVYNALQAKSISNLTIISNDAFADCSNNKYRTLNNNLNGTFIYWELNAKNKNII